MKDKRQRRRRGETVTVLLADLFSGAASIGHDQNGVYIRVNDRDKLTPVPDRTTGQPSRKR